ncbi:hypothetical protein Tco_0773097 [Tanacetum coccineum]|uniref:Uncharacterized protein n=1 Tax=Tanacetum coccineum TaxID=301880 RepID=A0ABQ4ZLZ3_9ASTR
MDAGEPPEMDPYEEVAQQGQAAPPSPAYVPDPIELEHHVPVYIPEPVYPEYLVPSDGDIPIKDPEEDPIDYAYEEEYLALADPTAVASPGVDLVTSVEETEPFETDESAATPPPPPTYRTISRMSVRSQAPIPFPSKAEVARLLVLPTPPPSLLTLLSSPLPHIPSPPLPLPSPPTTSYTYAEAPLGYKVAGIWMRAASPLPLPAPSTSRIADIPEADILPQKRLLLTTPTPRFEVGESSAAAARQPRSTVTQVVNLRVSYQADVRRRESEEFYTRHQDAQRDRATLRDEVDTLRRYLSSLCTTHEQERVEARQALDRSKAHNRAL